MKARDVMSSPVITVRPDTPAHLAAALLVSHGFSAAPVVADDRIVGIATEADLVRGRIASEGWTGEDPTEPTVTEAMSADPVVMGPDDDLADVVALLLDRGFRSVPIVADGNLIGIVSRRDVLRCVARRELTSAEVHLRRTGMAGHDRGGPVPTG